MGQHTHHHDKADNSDQWARQHAEKGAIREPELAKASQALLGAVHVSPGMRLLDVACGAGYTTAAATAAGAHATGIDTSAAMIQIARDQFPQTRFEVGNMLTPPEGLWDAVVCRLGGHHADPCWLSAAWTVLRPGGRLAVAERDAVDRESRTNGMKSLGEWLELFHEAGFDGLQVTPSGAEHDGPIYIISGRKPQDGEA